MNDEADTGNDSNTGGNEPDDPGGGSSPSPGFVIFCYLIVAVAAFAAVKWAEKGDVTIEVTEGFAPFAVIYIVAQAVERLVQPFTYFLGKAKEKEEAKDALEEANGNRTLALMANEPRAAAVEAATAADERRKLASIQANRAILFWAIATAAALLVCGRLGLGLIQSVAEVAGADGGEIPSWFENWDVVITGLAIGAGTKPLHDLISFIQSKKEKSEAAATPATG